MRILYLDPSLKTTVGHHFNLTTTLALAMRRQGHEVTVALSKFAEPLIEGERCFRRDVYTPMSWNTHGQRGRNRFDRAATQVSREISPLLQRVNPHLLYAQSADAHILVGLLAALGGHYQPGAEPGLVAEFPFALEQEPEQGANYYGKQLSDCLASIAADPRLSTIKFYPITVDMETSRRLASHIKKTVSTFPSPYVSADLRGTTPYEPGTPLHIGCIGHQRWHKGFHLIPEIIRQLEPMKDRIKFVIQIQNGNMDETNTELRNLRASGLPVELIDATLDQAAYYDLMARLQIVLLPYEPRRYQTSVSGIAYEAVSQGSVVVGPKNSVVGDLLRDVQPSAEPFADWTASTIAESLRFAVSNFETLHLEARKGAEIFLRSNGPDAFVRKLVAMASQTPPIPNSAARVRLFRAAQQLRAFGLELRRVV